VSFAGAQVWRTVSSHALRAGAPALEKDGHFRLLVANLTEQPQAIRLGAPFQQGHLRSPEPGTAPEAALQPETFRQRKGIRSVPATMGFT
jgi:hypothetical protein